MRHEAWLAVAGHEGRYAVSDLGNVMSMNYAKSGLPGILRTYLRRGYPSVYLFGIEPKGKWFTVHSLVAAAFIGPRPQGAHINHRNGNKEDPAAVNLEYCSASENMKHAFLIGLQSNRGERHSSSKLTDADVREIRKRSLVGETQAAIAIDYGVTQSAISNAIRGRNWSHIPFAGEERVVN